MYKQCKNNSLNKKETDWSIGHQFDWFSNFTIWCSEFKIILARVCFIVWYSIDFASFVLTIMLCSVGMTRFPRTELVFQYSDYGTFVFVPRKMDD